jgi:hypothetical protein
MKTQKRRLMWHGVLFFLLGLITGLLEQRFTNVRMGLSAHLEGVMNGILLLALGASWNEVRLKTRTCPSQVVRCEFVYAGILGRSLDDLPKHLGGHAPGPRSFLTC